MDISLDPLKRLLCQEKRLEPMTLSKIIADLENGRYESCKYDEFSLPIFLEKLGTQDYEKDPESALIFHMFFADFLIKNALLLADKQKLEVFTQIGLKLKVFNLLKEGKLFLLYKNRL